MPRSRLPILLVLALLAGCSKTATEPGGDTPALPPSLVATQPEARATGVLYDSEIWGQFDRSLEPATVNTKAVFLKLDGQRTPCTVAYESVTRRILVHPTVTLQLLRTYTVEFTPAVLGTDGTPLPEGVFFQFTTNSLRRPAYDYPVSGVLEGPLATLGWGGTQGPVNDLFYEVYAGTDSMQVLRRTTPILQKSVFTRFVPSAGWPAGQTVYWAITSENFITKERLSGPVQSFRVLDSSVPVESVVLNLRDYGSKDIRSTTQYCTRNTIPVGPSYNAAVHLDYTRLPADARVVGATMTCTMSDFDAGRFNSLKPVTAWMTQNDWQACSIVTPGPPYAEQSGLLASAVDATPTRLEFSAPRLAAFFEAQARQRTLLPGLVFRSSDNFNIQAPSTSGGTIPPSVTVQYQRLSAGVAR